MAFITKKRRKTMLVLTRRINEKLTIGQDVNVIVLGVKGNQVRLGIEAPESVNIVREELLRPDSKYFNFPRQVLIGAL